MKCLGMFTQNKEITKEIEDVMKEATLRLRAVDYIIENNKKRLLTKKDMKKYSEEKYSGASVRSNEEQIREIEVEINFMD
jgi:hypothetical protein